jgi:hypothetical protein
VSAAPGAVRCDDATERHLIDGAEAFVVTAGPETFHFCGEHAPYGCMLALVNAETRGRSEFFFSGLGWFEIRPSGGRANPQGENEERGCLAGPARTGRKRQHAARRQICVRRQAPRTRHLDEGEEPRESKGQPEPRSPQRVLAGCR